MSEYVPWVSLGIVVVAHVANVVVVMTRMRVQGEHLSSEIDKVTKTFLERIEDARREANGKLEQIDSGMRERHSELRNHIDRLDERQRTAELEQARLGALSSKQH